MSQAAWLSAGFSTADINHRASHDCRPTNPAAACHWRGRPHHDAFRARLLVAGGSLGDGPAHSIDRAPTSWLALAGGLLGLVALAAAVVFVL